VYLNQVPVIYGGFMTFYHKGWFVCAVLSGMFCLQPSKASSAVMPEQQEISQPEAELEVIEVLGRRASGLKLSSKKILQVAGSGNDPLRALEALPGVTLATPATGGPVAKPAIRGSSPVDNEYRTDTLPVGYVFHNDGLSTLNPLLIEDFTLYAGSWDAQYQDATGAVIATTLRDPSADHAGWTLDAGAIRSALLYESALHDDAAFYLSLRQSFIHLYIDKFIEDEEFDFATPPRNNDYQSKLSWQIDSQNQLRLLATGAQDKIRRRFDVGSRDVAKNPDLASGEGYRSSYQQLGLVWDNFSTLGDSKVVVNYLNKTEEIAEGLAWNLNADLSEWLLRASTISSLAGGELHWGLALKRQQNDWLARGRLQPCNAELELCPPGLYAPLVAEQAAVAVQFASGHLVYQWPIAPRWQLGAGLALDHNDFTAEFFAEPRLTLNWQLDAQWQLEFKAGAHHQWFRRPELLSSVFGNPALKLETARHLGFGLSHHIDPLWHWQLELYHKTLDNLFVSNPARQSVNFQTQGDRQQVAFVNGARGTAQGVEFLLNRNLADGWYAWFSLGYAKTKRHNTLTGQDFNYEWDLPLMVNTVLTYQWDDHWQLGLKWRYQSGRRFTEIYGATPVYPKSLAHSDSTAAVLFYDPIEGELNGGRRGALHRLDLRVDYQTVWGQYPVTWYFEVLNVYAHKTVQEQEWNADYSTYEEDYEFPDFPLPGLGVTIRF